MQKEINLVLKRLKGNDFFGFNKEFKKHNLKDITFNKLLRETIEEIYYGEFNPYLEDMYLDYSYMVVNDKIINVDLIWGIFMENINEIVGA